MTSHDETDDDIESDNWFPAAVTTEDGAIVGEGLTLKDPLGDTFTLTKVGEGDDGLYAVVEGSGYTWQGWKTFTADELNEYFEPVEDGGDQ